LPKKKKNRLGQRARQQLGRAKQSQQMLHGPYFTPPLLVGISRLLTRLHDNHSQQGIGVDGLFGLSMPLPYTEHVGSLESITVDSTNI